MALDETLAVVGNEAAITSLEPYSVAWWESRTGEELRDIINRGFAGGQAFQSAVAEVERRAREETSRLRAAAALEAERRNKRNRLLIRAAGALAAMTIVAMWNLA